MAEMFSPEMIQLVRESEGLRLKAYLCPAGVPTIGYGHTKGVTRAQVDAGRTISQEQADRFLMEDLAATGRAVDKLVTVPVSLRQRDALISFAFNVGSVAFSGSTLLQKLNKGDYAGATAEFPRWNKATVNAKKVILPGLVARRAAEQALFLGAFSGVPQEVSSVNEKPLAASKTIAGGVVAGVGTIGGLGIQEIIDALGQAKGPLADMAGTLEVARYALMAVTLAGACLTIYARIVDRREGVK